MNGLKLFHNDFTKSTISEAFKEHKIKDHSNFNFEFNIQNLNMRPNRIFTSTLLQILELKNSLALKEASHAAKQRQSSECGAITSSNIKESYPELTNWYLISISKGEVEVAGSIRGSMIFKNVGTVKKAENMTFIETNEGKHYQLIGEISEELSHAEGVPRKIINLFKKGFPSNWKSIIKEADNGISHSRSFSDDDQSKSDKSSHVHKDSSINELLGSSDIRNKSKNSSMNKLLESSDIRNKSKNSSMNKLLESSDIRNKNSSMNKLLENSDIRNKSKNSSMNKLLESSNIRNQSKNSSINKFLESSAIRNQNSKRHSTRRKGAEMDSTIRKDSFSDSLHLTSKFSKDLEKEIFGKELVVTRSGRKSKPPLASWCGERYNEKEGYVSMSFGVPQYMINSIEAKRLSMSMTLDTSLQMTPKKDLSSLRTPKRKQATLPKKLDKKTPVLKKSHKKFKSSSPLLMNQSNLENQGKFSIHTQNPKINIDPYELFDTNDLSDPYESLPFYKSNPIEKDMEQSLLTNTVEKDKAADKTTSSSNKNPALNSYQSIDDDDIMEHDDMIDGSSILDQALTNTYRISKKRNASILAKNNISKLYPSSYPPSKKAKYSKSSQKPPEVKSVSVQTIRTPHYIGNLIQNRTVLEKRHKVEKKSFKGKRSEEEKVYQEPQTSINRGQVDINFDLASIDLYSDIMNVLDKQKNKMKTKPPNKLIFSSIVQNNQITPLNIEKEARTKTLYNVNSGLRDFRNDSFKKKKLENLVWSKNYDYISF